MKRKLLIAVGILAAIFVAYQIYIVIWLPADQVELLFTSPSQNMSALRLTGHGKSVTISDKDVIECFNRAFHHGPVTNFEGGITYEAKLHFHSGKSANTAIYFYEACDGFTIALPTKIHRTGDPEYRDVRFAKPIPENVVRLLKSLTSLPK